MARKTSLSESDPKSGTVTDVVLIAVGAGASLIALIYLILT